MTVKKIQQMQVQRYCKLYENVDCRATYFVTITNNITITRIMSHYRNNSSHKWTLYNILDLFCISRAKWPAMLDINMYTFYSLLILSLFHLYQFGRQGEGGFKQFEWDARFIWHGSTNYAVFIHKQETNFFVPLFRDEILLLLLLSPFRLQYPSFALG